MSVLATTILIVHYLLVGILCLYGAHRIYHTYLAKRHIVSQSPTVMVGEFPFVTVQAPIFNEQFVVERLIDALVEIDYPRDKLQIQVLDDSTDETVELAAERVSVHRKAGINIVHIHRTNRQGFKAGALEEALSSAEGELIAIFDADFLPPSDFLKNVVPHFSSSEIGMVQTRWQHLNRDHNLLTRVQSIMLDAHFGIEQVARSQTGAFFNFNGTAGIWRKETIIDAGGWRADTLTEDLDLSYRAQLKNWQFLYLHEVGCPSELPVEMAAFKTQQHRWAKGAIEVMKRVLRTVWKSPVGMHTKIEATFHLTGNFSYMLMFVDSLFFLLPAIHIREQAAWHFLAWVDIPLFFFASLSHAWFFLYSQKILYGKMVHGISILPVLLATSIGIGINNGRAVMEALAGHVTEFVRTPKTGDTAQRKFRAYSQGRARYTAVSALWADWLEIILACVYFAYLVWAVSREYWIVAPFLALFCIGFFFTGSQSLIVRLQKWRRA